MLSSVPIRPCIWPNAPVRIAFWVPDLRDSQEKELTHVFAKQTLNGKVKNAHTHFETLLAD
jgi:hypothetical protein